MKKRNRCTKQSRNAARQTVNVIEYKSRRRPQRETKTTPVVTYTGLHVTIYTHIDIHTFHYHRVATNKQRSPIPNSLSCNFQKFQILLNPMKRFCQTCINCKVIAGGEKKKKKHSSKTRRRETRVWNKFLSAGLRISPQISSAPESQTHDPQSQCLSGRGEARNYTVKHLRTIGRRGIKCGSRAI